MSLALPSLGSLPILTDIPIGGAAPVSTIGLDIEHQGSSISLSYARVDVPNGTIHFGRTPSMSETSSIPDLGGQLNKITGRVEFRCAVMSREHATLRFGDDGKVYLRDLPACHHGTTITRANSEIKLDKTQEYQIFDGDRITFGKAVHKGGVIHQPLYALVRFGGDDIFPRTALTLGKYRLSSADLYTDDEEIRREATPPWRKDLWQFSGLEGNFSFDIAPEAASSSPISVDDDDNDEDEDSVVEFVPDSMQVAPPSSLSTPETAAKPSPPGEVIDLTREPSLPRVARYEIIEDSEPEDVVFMPELLHPIILPPIIQRVPDPEVLPFASNEESESPKSAKKLDLEHLLNGGNAEREEVRDAIPDPVEKMDTQVALADMQNGIDEIREEIQKLRVHRLKAKRRMSLNQNATEVTIQNLVKELKEIENRLDDSAFNDHEDQINGEVEMAMSAVAKLASDVQDGKNAIADMLADIRELRIECEKIMKAEVENLEAVRKSTELSLKRKADEMQQDGIEAPLIVPAGFEGPSPVQLIENHERLIKRRRILPAFGAGAAKFLMGVVAGSIGTVVALAMAEDA